MNLHRSFDCNQSDLYIQWLFGIFLIFAILSPPSAFAVMDIPARTIISRDTVWQGDVLVHGDVRVESGATLVIMPDTKVAFVKISEFGPDKLSKDKNNHFPRAEIIVRGKLIAQGLPGRPVVFTSAEKHPSLADWGAVNFIGSRDNLMEYCELSYGHTSIHCHSAQVVVSHCTFSHNGVAIGQKNVKSLGMKCSVPIMYCVIRDNGGGVLFGGGTCPVIVHNDIRNNKFFGIFAKKSGPASIRYNNIVSNGKGIILYAVKDILIRDNNIAENVDYEMSLLEGQIYDVKACHNWWGVADAAGIRQRIRDHANDSSLGHIDFSDFATAPVDGAGLF